MPNERWIRTIRDPEEGRRLLRRARQKETAVAEWSRDDGALRFTLSIPCLCIIQTRNGEVTNGFLYATPDAARMDWAAIVGVQWKVRGDLWSSSKASRQ